MIHIIKPTFLHPILGCKTYKLGMSMSIEVLDYSSIKTIIDQYFLVEYSLLSKKTFFHAYVLGVRIKFEVRNS